LPGSAPSSQDLAALLSSVYSLGHNPTTCSLWNSLWQGMIARAPGACGLGNEKLHSHWRSFSYPVKEQ